MLWEELTAAEFKEAVAKTAETCMIPMGIMEKHGDHLPLGTDLINIRALAVAASSLEDVVIFPPFYFGQICEAQHVPGTLSFDAQFLLNTLRTVCHEIARNGFKKIILVNGHGGNTFLIPFFTQMNLDLPKDYVLYFLDIPWRNPEELEKIIETKTDEHGGEIETSMMLKVRPDLVKLDRVKLTEGVPQKRLAHLWEQGIYTAIWWYADYPYHFAGDPIRATPEKGAKLLDLGAAHLAKLIKTIKQDTVTAQLQQEFFQRALDPLSGI